MSESNYNFRNALKEIKAIKKAELSIEVDKALRKIMLKNAESQELFAEESLNQILFVHDGNDVDAYIKKITINEDEIHFIRVATYSTNCLDDAANLMKAIRSKLILEEFVVESYTLPATIRGINGFIVDTKER